MRYLLHPSQLVAFKCGIQGRVVMTGLVLGPRLCVMITVTSGRL